ncbi:MAG: hypothetical protein ACM3SX_23965, partial [Deltaproteobacteria bacterium]
QRRGRLNTLHGHLSMVDDRLLHGARSLRDAARSSLHGGRSFATGDGPNTHSVEKLFLRCQATSGVPVT